MACENISKMLSELIVHEKYAEAINILNSIKDEQKRREECFAQLAVLGMERAIEEYGEVTVLDDKEKYERAIAGMEDIPPHAVIYRNPKTDDMDGLERMVDFVPEDNPLKQYWRKIESAA